jgi:hypothetical protein
LERLSETEIAIEGWRRGGVIVLTVGCLRNLWAVAAYVAFASYQARAAFDHDFAKPLSAATL